MGKHGGDEALSAPEPLDRRRLARVVADQGGVVNAIAHGVTSDRIIEVPLRQLWAAVERGYAAIAPTVTWLEQALESTSDEAE